MPRNFNLLKPLISQLIYDPDLMADTIETGVKYEHADLFSQESTRLGLGKAIDKMTDTDPYIESAIWFIVRAASTFNNPDKPRGFYIKADGEILKVLEPMIARTDLQGQTNQILYNMYKYGDNFSEVIYGGDTENQYIAAVKSFPKPSWIRANVDKFGNLRRGDPSTCDFGQAAYDEYIEGYVAYQKFSQAQIAHFRFGTITGSPYGVPPLRSAIPAWKQLKAVLELIASSFLDLASLRIHKVAIPMTWSSDKVRLEMKKYRQRMTGQTTAAYSTIDGNFQLGSTAVKPINIYMPCRVTRDGKMVEGKIETIESGDFNFEESLIQIWRGNVFAALNVPPTYLYAGLGAPTSRGDAEEIRMRHMVYALAVNDLQNSYKETIERLCQIELLISRTVSLDDVFNESIFTVVMPHIPLASAISLARERQAQAQAILMGAQAGLPLKWWLEKVLNLSLRELKELGDIQLNVEVQPVLPPNAETIAEQVVSLLADEGVIG